MNVKRKGSAFERAVAKRFSEWIGHPHAFWRSVNSGAFGATKHTEVGDIVPASGFLIKNWRFVVECKDNKALSFDRLLCRDSEKRHADPLVRMWQTVVKQAAQHQMIPWLVMNLYRRGVMLLMPEDFYQRDIARRCPASVLSLTLREPKIAVMPLSEFFQHVTPRDLRLSLHHIERSRPWTVDC